MFTNVLLSKYHWDRIFYLLSKFNIEILSFVRISVNYPHLFILTIDIALRLFVHSHHRNIPYQQIKESTLETLLLYFPASNRII